MNKSVDDALRKRLRKYTEEPDGRLWNNIAERFEADNRRVALNKRIRNGYIFLAGLIIIGGIYLVLQPGIKNNHSASEIEVGLKHQSKDENESASGTIQPSLNQDRLGLKANEGQRPSRNNHQNKSNELTGTALDNSSPLRESELVEIILADEEYHIKDIPATALLHHQADGQVIKQENDSTHFGKKISEINSSQVATESSAEPEKKKHSPLNIYFTIMPTFGYQHIESNSNDNIIIESIDRISAFSMDRLGVRAEVGIEHPIAKRFKIFGGFLYYQRNQTIGYTEKQIDNTQIFHGENGEIIIEPEFKYVHKSFEYELQNVGLQVGINYVLSKKKFLQTAGTGVEFQIALNKIQENAQAPELTNNPTAYVFYNLYYRVQYPADGKLKAIVQPTLNYSFYINQNFNAPFYVQPYGLGLNIGCTYNF